MKKCLWKKGLILGIIILFVGAGVIPSAGGIVENTSSTIIGSPGYIQDLIDNASAGDTINIPSGTYYENIVINKSINLVGEDKETTIIDGGGSGDVVEITTDWVNISGFTIQNSGYTKYDEGIIILSKYNTIFDNNILNNSNGIYLFGYSNTIIKNNFLDNNVDAFFKYPIKNILSKKNLWRQNYWNEPRLLPKPIRGQIWRRISSNVPPFYTIHLPWFNIDWRPALKPYDI